MIQPHRSRFLGGPRRDLGGVDPYGIIFDPGSELLENLVMAVFANPGVVAVVPIVKSAHELVSLLAHPMPPF